VLVFAEVALGVVLVTAAGLLIRTFAGLMNRDPGFNPNHVMSASLSLQDARYSTATAGARLFRESLDEIRAIPGVESAAVALSLPYQRPLNGGVERITGRDIRGKDQIVNYNYVTSGFFETLQIPLLRGRVFTEADTAKTAKVAVVNQAFVQYYLPNQPNPIGAHSSRRHWCRPGFGVFRHKVAKEPYLGCYRLRSIHFSRCRESAHRSGSTFEHFSGPAPHTPGSGGHPTERVNPQNIKF
jgi:hypothetical protein